MSGNFECSLEDRRRRRLEEAENIRRWLRSIQERQYLDAQLAKQKADEDRVANLHYEHICRQQRINGGRWYVKRKLRAEEIRTQTTGLVLAEEDWMRTMDGRLEKDGIFIPSKTRKYLVDVELGIIPQLPPKD
jgi:hypothetical protein